MTDSLTSRVEAWRGDGEYVEVGGNRIFLRRRNAPGPLRLFLHGLPSSSYDGRRTLSSLDHVATLTLDFLGFGLSDKPRHVSRPSCSRAIWKDGSASTYPEPFCSTAA